MPKIDNECKKRETHTALIPAFRVKPSEYALIHANAKQAGFSTRSAYLRHVGCHPAIVVNQGHQHDATLIRQLMGIGNNLNQLTKRAHSRGHTTRDVEHLHACLERLDIVLQQIAEW